MVKKQILIEVTEIESKIPGVSSLATKSTLTVVENKIPDVSSLVKKTNFNTKVTEIEGKIPSITGLATNSELSAVENKIPDVSSLVKKTNLDAELKRNSDRITSNKSRHLQIENEVKKLQKFDAAYFRGKNYFDGNDGPQNSLVFQVGEKHFKNNFGSNSSKIEIWKSKGLSSQSLNLSGTVGTANDIKMSNPIRPAYVIFNHKKSFFEQKKKIA